MSMDFGCHGLLSPSLGPFILHMVTPTTFSVGEQVIYATESALTHLIKQQILVLPLVHRTTQLACCAFIQACFLLAYDHSSFLVPAMA